ncbi:uncharacterized protein LOC141712126 isoform X2 [Apium graveolens]|uniref:uncharacterized protein LOC141712126 isoform X2 n=1 Tax=Apium graveolens TaxID=4045 RepID=UPI003D794CE8
MSLTSSKRPSLSNQFSIKPVLRRRMNPIDKFAPHASIMAQFNSMSEDKSPLLQTNTSKRHCGPSNHTTMPKNKGIYRNYVSGWENINPNFTPSANSIYGNLETTRQSLRRLSQNIAHDSSRFPNNIGAGTMSRKTPPSQLGTGPQHVSEQSYMTPSQRRLSNIDLSGISYQSSVTRILHRPSALKPAPRPNFELPASRISPSKNLYSSTIDKRLLESYNRDRGMTCFRQSCINCSHSS